MIESVPPPPPLLSDETKEEISPSSRSTTSSKKSKRRSPKISSPKMSSMIPRRLSDGSMKKKKEEKRRSKSPKPNDPFRPKRIAKSNSLNENLDKPASLSSFMSDHSLKKKRGDKKRSKSPKRNDPFLPKRLSDGSMKKKKEEKRRSKSPKPTTNDPFLPRRLSDGSMKKKKDQKRGSKSPKPSDPLLPKRIGKSKTKSFNQILDMNKKSSGSSSNRKISRNNASFTDSKMMVSSNDSVGSLRSVRSNRSIGSHTSIGSRGSFRSFDNLRLPPQRTSSSKSKSRTKKAAETKAIMDSLVSSLLPTEVASCTTSAPVCTTTAVTSSSSPRKVSFHKSVCCKLVDHSKFEHQVMWWTNLEIMNHRNREQAINREARNDDTDLDVEGRFTMKERNVRNSRISQAFEAVFDMQMVHKKEQELEAAVGIFHGGLYMEALEGDQEDAMATEYMQVAAPAMESAVLRAAHLQIHVQLLWEDGNEKLEEPPNHHDCQVTRIVLAQ